jgi:hypothetical protein
MSPQILRQDDIKKLFPEGVKDVFFSDADYAMFTERFLTQEGFQGFKKWLKFCGIKSVGQKRYWKRNYDCDNLANAYKTYMNLLHAKANPLSFTQSFKTGKENETKAQGVAVGVIYFEIKGKKTSSHHAINMAITRGLRNELVSVFIEPNAAGRIKLTKQERESIWYVNF